MTTPPQPSWRKPAGMFMILGLIAIWAGIVASCAAWVGQWPGLVQLAFYVVTGIVWIAPLKPLLSWMETGRWRRF
jgi:predicted membrane channel-forming protein YqfA (hemolysin III family)